MKSVLLGEQNGLEVRYVDRSDETSWVSNPLSRPRQPQEGRACTGAFLMLLSGRVEEGARLGGGGALLTSVKDTVPQTYLTSLTV